MVHVDYIQKSTHTMSYLDDENQDTNLPQHLKAYIILRDHRVSTSTEQPSLQSLQIGNDKRYS